MRCFDPKPFAALAFAALAPWALAAAQNPGVSETTTTVIRNPGPGSNRIEVTGNTANNVRVDCDAARRTAAGASTPAPTANVNSVNIDGAALQGRSVVIAGRNSRDVRVDGADCGRGAAPVGNVNSVNIR